MLIRFTIENFLSFKEKQVFSMLPGKGTLKSHHKSAPVQGVSVLKTALLFGANASGKSNLIKAIDFGKQLLLKGTKPDEPIRYQPFRLDKQYQQQNTYLEYEISYMGKNYAYGFVFNAREIVDEWLYVIGKKVNQKIFERSNTTRYDLHALLKSNNSKEEKRFLEFLSSGTPRNRLFLNHLRNHNTADNLTDITDVLNTIDWFQNALTVIYPGSKNIGEKFELSRNADLQQLFSEFLSYFDTGVTGIEFEPIDFAKLEVPEDIKDEIRGDLLNQKSAKSHAFLTNLLADKYYVITRGEGVDMIASVLKTKHMTSEGTYELFDLKDESDGTRRIMDLIPLLNSFFQNNSVIVIDEIERSLHPNLVKDFFDFVLNHCEHINSQFIAASHEATLLTQQLLRKDEIWFSVKEPDGATRLHSLEDYSVRFDKRIMKDYLMGRYHGVPRLGDRSAITVLPNRKN